MSANKSMSVVVVAVIVASRAFAAGDAARVAGDLKVDGIHFSADGSVIRKLSDLSSLWTLLGSDIYYLGGNVGIGTATPMQRLSVAGTIETTAGGVKFPDGTLQTTAGGATLGPNMFSGTQTFLTGAAANKGLIVKGTAGQTANLQEWQDSAGTTMAAVSARGDMTLASTLNLPATTAFTGIIMSGADTLIHARGYQSFFAGARAGNLSVNDDWNTAVGYRSLASHNGGNGNTAIGSSALASNTGGSNNAALGFSALVSNTTGSANTACGTAALQNNGTGTGNVATGLNSLNKNTIGNFNNGYGNVALFANTIGSNNSAVGTSALRENTTGNGNTALGYQAGYMGSAANANTTGTNNTFVGANSGPGTSAQLTNATAIGYNALVSQNNSLVLGGTGIDAVNVGIGTQTPSEQLELTGNLRLPATTATTGIIKSGTNTLIHAYGLSNFFAGLNAGNLTMSGMYNTSVGPNAFVSNSSGRYNTAAGYQSLNHNTLGEYNTALGSNALYVNLDGDRNTATGHGALLSNSSGNSNTAEGVYALRFSSSGSSNTAIGEAALMNNTTGSNNTALGYSALSANTLGNLNTAIGYNANVVNSTGLTNATAIGAYAAVGGNHSLVLGGTGDYAVKVGIGTTTPSEVLDVVGNIRLNDKDIYFRTGTDTLHGLGFYGGTKAFASTDVNGPVLYGNGGGALGSISGTTQRIALSWNGAGNVTAQGDLTTQGSLTVNSIPTGSTQYVLCSSLANRGVVQRCSASSRKMKENIADLSLGLDTVNKLRPVSFTWKANGNKDVGFIAEEVALLQPVLAIYNEQGEPDGVKYAIMSAVLVKAVQEQQQEIERQKTKIESQGAILEELKAELAALKAIMSR